MRELTFRWENAEITVGEETGLDELITNSIRYEIGRRLVGNDDIESIPPIAFSTVMFADRVIRQTRKIVGDIGFSLPSPLSGGDELYQAYQSLMKAPKGLIKAWVEALNNINKPPVEMELAVIPEKNGNSANAI